MLKLVLVVALMLLVMPQAMAVDINVDGDIDDWGLEKLKTGDWSAPSTWVPTKDGISFFVEDNQDPKNVGAINYNASYTGVHIYGNKTFQDNYTEPLLRGVWAEPVGGLGGKFGEMYDIEAMYITENDTHIFVLIVFSTGVYENKPFVIGDLALDFVPGIGGYGYEYGLNLHRYGDTKGQEFGIYETLTEDSWTVPQFQENKPAEINFSVVDPNSSLGTAVVVYSNLGKDDYGFANHIAEIAIPKNVIGNPDLPDDPKQVIGMFWISEYCGNDAGPSIPEFLIVLIPVGIILGLMYYLKERK